ncbi:MAG: hypothetical protein K0Q95_461, partial [Bacteroidota bacterium]|nr:hypothetical protein [Bacteroidota bacterium]
MKYILLTIVSVLIWTSSIAQTCVTDAGNDVSICSGNSIQIGSAPVGGFSYSWSPATGLSDNQISSPQITLTNSGAGPLVFSYTLTATDTSGCVATDVINITVNPNPLINVNSAAICNGQNTILTASGASEYIWSTGSSSNPVSVSPTSTTSYTVTGSAFGCSSTAVAIVTVNNPPSTPTASSNSPVCSGSAINLSASGVSGAVYSWTGPNNFSSNLQSPVITGATPVASGTYSVTATVNGCTGAAATTSVVVGSPIINNTIVLKSVCKLSSNTARVIIEGQPPLVSGGNGTYLYSWGFSSPGNNGPFVTINGQTGPTLTLTQTVNNGFYQRTVTSGGCTSTSNFLHVNINSGVAQVSVTPTNPVICPGGSVSLTASGGVTYTWSPSTGLNTTGGSTVTASPAVTTTYTVTGTDGTTCSGNNGTATVTVTVSQPSITVNSATICLGASAALTASGAVSYTWSDGQSGNPVTVLPDATTSYTVTGVDAAGCSSTAVSTVTVNSTPSITVNSPTICSGTSATLTGIGGSAYSWSSGETTASINVSPTTTTSYTVTGTDAHGCSNSAVATVTIGPNPTITVNSETICSGASATL